MIIPKKLNIGDKIGIVSTARKISIEELNPAIEIIQSWGLEVVLGKFLFEENNQLAGTIEQRVCDFQEMINNDNILYFHQHNYLLAALVLFHVEHYQVANLHPCI